MSDVKCCEYRRVLRVEEKHRRSIHFSLPHIQWKKIFRGACEAKDISRLKNTKHLSPANLIYKEC